MSHIPAASPPAVEVRTPGRLHLGMFSFGNPAVPSFGGVGVMVDAMGITVRLTRSARFNAAGPLAERAVQFARQAAAAWSLDDAACTIEVLESPRPHVGLGSGTQLALAVAAGLRRLFVDGAATDAERLTVAEAFELSAAVQRGRRSSVGIYGFAGGGLIAERGRMAADEGGPPSPLLARVELPEAWRCLVLIRRGAAGLHGDAEKAAFARLPPVPADLSAELVRIASEELVPAARQGRFEAFSDAVGRYGRLAGQPFESESSRLTFHDAIGRLIAVLGELGVVGAAQSSWGPAVMACCPSAAAAEELVAELSARGLAVDHDITIARFNTIGASLREVH